MKYIKAFTIISILVIVIFDVLAVVLEWGTISELIATVSYSYPVVPFAVGILCGHWFWPVKALSTQGKCEE